MRRFSFYQRNGVFYARFRDPATGQRLPGRSTGMDNRDEALLVVHDWLNNGLPATETAKKVQEKPSPVSRQLEIASLITSLRALEIDGEGVKKIERVLYEKGLISLMVLKDSPETESFEDFLIRFWTYEKSPYVSERLSHKLRIGRTHTKLSLERAKKYWIPYFKGQSIGSIQRKDLQEF
jgi:hypothetical protein